VCDLQNSGDIAGSGSGSCCREAHCICCEKRRLGFLTGFCVFFQPVAGDGIEDIGIVGPRRECASRYLCELCALGVDVASWKRLRSVGQN